MNLIISQIWEEMKRFQSSDKPSDRQFYLWCVNEFLIWARILYKFKESEELKTIGLGLKKISEEYRIYPLVVKE